MKQNPEVEPINWTLPVWLPSMKLSLLVGYPSAGKSTIACAIAAKISNGGTIQEGVL